MTQAEARGEHGNHAAGVEHHSDDLLQLASFRLGGRLFGVNIMDVKEINANVEITPVHHSPRSIRGYMNIRGQIYLVVDLHAEFDFEQTEITHESRVIIFKQSVDESFGILVDSVADVVKVDEMTITDRREGGWSPDDAALEKRKAREDLCIGVCPLEKELMLVLDARAILAAEAKNK